MEQVKLKLFDLGLFGVLWSQGSSVLNHKLRTKRESEHCPGSHTKYLEGLNATADLSTGGIIVLAGPKIRFEVWEGYAFVYLAGRMSGLSSLVLSG